MTFVPTSRMLPRALWRPAIFFFAVAQFVLAFAPLLEGRFGPDARAHTEAAGTNLHHAHNDADCAACTARGLMAGAEPGVKGLVAIRSSVQAPLSLTHRSSGHSPGRTIQPRAPPTAIA